MHDETEAARRQRLAEITAEACERAELEQRYGQVWDTRELARDFIVIGFLSPLVVVKRKDTTEKGSLEFQPGPPAITSTTFETDATAGRSSLDAESTSSPSGAASRPCDGHPLVGCREDNSTTEDE